MSLADARSLDAAATLQAGVCIVGAGAAGITLATELGRAGCDVLLLESGGLHADEETQALYDLDVVGHPVREEFMSRARYFGGSCNLWAGRSMRLDARDLTPRSWVPESGWPLAWEELAEHYPRAARILGLPPPECFEPNVWRERLSADERELFRDPLTPAVSLWAPSPKRFARARRELSRSRRVRLLLHANATKLVPNENGTAIESLEIATLDGRRATVRARVYVLACGGLENARLLLVSRDRAPNGLGNENDLVGRYFMDHPRAVYGSVRLRRPGRFPLLRARPLRDGKVQLGLRLTREVQEREGLLDHYATFERKVSGYAEASYQSFVQTMKVLLRRGYAGKRRDLFRKRLGNIPGMVYLLTPKELLPHPVYRWGTLFREAVLPAPEEEERIVVYFCEQPPDPESRVTLGPERDRLGLPRLALHWRLDERVTRSLERLQAVLGAELARRGIGELTPGEGEPAYTDASHHMGTTRMGAHPRSGVVDPECKVHGLANLYVAGSSVFPSAGHQNPTLTLVALTLRLGERLVPVAGRG